MWICISGKKANSCSEGDWSDFKEATERDRDGPVSNNNPALTTAGANAALFGYTSQVVN